MILIRRFTDQDTVAEEQEVDEIDFDMLVIYFKEYLMNPTTYDVRTRRFWGKKPEYMEMELTESMESDKK